MIYKYVIETVWQFQQNNIFQFIQGQSIKSNYNIAALNL